MESKINIDAAKSFVKEMNDMAEELYQVRVSLNTQEERFKRETDDLYNKEAFIKAQLLERLKAVGLKSVKVSSGDSWFISKKIGVSVLNELSFNAWATKNKLVKPDIEKAKDFLKKMIENKKELPPCVEFVDKDSISIRKSKTV